ncbi:MAG: amino acid ABC transporter substrate-binding protein [Planctomycetes bacterium]|nr:amino acid ABC transporter substrate-binding protein [Planctomycetota bacterium]
MRAHVFTLFLIILPGTGLAMGVQPDHPPAVLIGYFGPNDVAHPEAGNLWCAASMAIEQANLAGGFHGRPFKLMTGWSENPWGSGVTDLARMVYEDRVWAIVGGIDGPSTHLAEQVVAKARLPLLSGANADRTANLANVAWMFSTLPGHHLQAAALTQALESRVKHNRFVMVSSVDHDSHILTDELNKCFRKRHLSPSYHFEFELGQTGQSALVDRVMNANARAVVIAAPALGSADLLVSLRQGGFQGLVFGGPCLSQERFIKRAGEASEGVIFPVLYAPSEQSVLFDTAFFNRFGKRGDYLSAHTYDTVTLLTDAIRRAGLDRQGIRDELEQGSPWQGVTGTIRWDAQGSNIRRVVTGTLLNGCVTLHRAVAPKTSSPVRPQSR